MDEVRLETIIPGRCGEGGLEDVLAAHPYEEVAYDLYPLSNPRVRGGPGRLGSLPEPIPLEELAAKVKGRLGGRSVRVSGELAQKVQARLPYVEEAAEA